MFNVHPNFALSAPSHLNACNSFLVSFQAVAESLITRVTCQCLDPVLVSQSAPAEGWPVIGCQGVAWSCVGLRILHCYGDILMEDHLTSAKPPTIYKITAGAVRSSALLFILINFATIKLQLQQTLQPNHQ